MAELVHQRSGGGAVYGHPGPGAGREAVLHVDVLLDVENNPEAQHTARQGGGPGAAGPPGHVRVERVAVAESCAGVHFKITGSQSGETLSED